MKLAYFIAIHKAQGLILPVVVIDIGVIEFAFGYTYVDVSRVRQLIDIRQLIKFYDKKSFDRIGRSKSTKAKIEYIKSLSTKFKVRSNKFNN